MFVSTLRVWFSRLAAIWQAAGPRPAEEMESHLQMHIEDNLREGMSPEEARRQALIKLGGVEQTKENYRERRVFRGSKRCYRTCASVCACCEIAGVTFVIIVTLARELALTQRYFR